MAELLLHWINHELGLSTHVTNMEVDFASGYLLGEILHRLNHQHNFTDFMRSSSADAKILNFCLLEPPLRNLNVKFDANVAAAIMNENKNAAANLLYQIKIAASRVGRAPAVSTKSLERTGIIPLHNRPVKLAKPAYDTEKLRLFEHSVRRHTRSISSLQQEKDQIADEAIKIKVYREKMAEQKEVLEATKAERLHRAYIHSSFIKEALEETDSPAWRLALQKKSAREQRRAAFFQQLVKKREEAEENLTFSLRQKVRNDLDDFDAEGGSNNSLASGKVTSRKSVGYGLRSLTTALNESSDKKKHSTSNLAGSSMNERELYHANILEMESASSVIKQQRQRREKRKENLSRRRKRFVQECVYSHTRIGTARVANILEDVVLRNTNGEKDVHGEMDRILIYKEVARENRSMRNQEYMNQKESDSVAAMDRDTGCYHNLLLRFEDDCEMQTLQQKNVQTSIEAAGRFLSEEISSAIMHEMVEFMLVIAEKREETLHSRDPSVFLTAETWNEYKINFVNGCNVVKTYLASATNNSSQAELLDKHELEVYLSSFLPFQTTSEQQTPLTTINNGSLFIGAQEAIKDCFILGEAIKSLRWITYLSSSQTDAVLENDELKESAEPSVPTSVLPSLRSHQHLRILVFGPPFAGKETQAKLLGEMYNLSVISVHELIQSAVENSSDIGYILKSLLVNGKEIPPELYSRLVMDSIGEIESQNLPQNIDSKAGWVIYDLPATNRHDQSLEEHLSGYKDPAAIPSPFDFESPLAPGQRKLPLLPSFFHGKSGVDLVFHIDCPIDSVLDRCLGQVEDTTTGTKNHLVFDPPPDDSIARHRLQHVNPTAYASEFLSLHCLANDGFSPDHKSWHTKFKTLHEFSNTGMNVSEIHDAIANIVSNLLNEKREEADAKQFKLEAGEQELMASEEERQRRLDAFISEIDEAEIDVAKTQASLTEAEEAKAKKEELLEIRQKLEDVQHHLDGVLTTVKNWAEEERSCRPVPSSKYSGELVPATARALTALWNDMEVEYIAVMKTSFALLREERHQVTDRAQIMTREFCEFVRRPDQKQEFVNVFQRQFNEVIDEMRFNDLTKFELHARTDILQDELRTLVESKFTQNEEELCNLVGDGWTEDTCQHVAAIYQMALQAECDRFRTSVQILVDGHYAASSDHSQLNSIVEIWHSHQPRLEVACRVYRDPTCEIPVETPSAPAATGKAAPKGKAKAPASAVAPPTNPAASSEDALAESLTLTELLAEYGHVLQRCSSWMEAINSIADTHEQVEEGICKVNLLNGIRYEYDMMERRVRFLQEATEKSCDEITRSMRSIEITLRGVLEDRKNREHAAVAGVVEYVRAAIEAEVALPTFIDVSPEFVERFPTTVQLREDTMVRIDGHRRLLPRSPPDAPPIIEEAHELLLNPRQRDDLQEVLISQTIDNSGFLPLITIVETIAALTSLPDAVPNVWRRCPAHVIAEIAARFPMKQSALIDIEALLTAMSTQEDLLRQFQEDEARDELERQQQLELERQQEYEHEILLQQQQNENNEPDPADLAQ